MPTKPTCFCGGDGKYTDYNCGAEFLVSCPHCRGTGTKKCECTKPDTVCKTYGRGHEIDERRTVDDDADDPHWMFMD